MVDGRLNFNFSNSNSNPSKHIWFTRSTNHHTFIFIHYLVPIRYIFFYDKTKLYSLKNK